MIALSVIVMFSGQTLVQYLRDITITDPVRLFEFFRPTLRLTKASRLHSHWLHSQAATRLFESSPKRRGSGNQRGEGGRPEDVSCLDSGRQQHGAQIWTKDRTDSPNPQGPTDAGRANRGRIVFRRQRIRTR